MRGNSSRNTTSNKHTQNQATVPIQHDNFDLSDVDHVPSNAKFSRLSEMLYIFEDNEAVIKGDMNSIESPWGSRKLLVESQIQTPLKRESERLITCRMWTASPQTQILLNASLSCTFLKTTKQSSR